MEQRQPLQNYRLLISRLNSFLNLTNTYCKKIDATKDFSEKIRLKNKLIDIYGNAIVNKKTESYNDFTGNLGSLVNGAILDLQDELFTLNNNSETLKSDIRIEVSKVLKRAAEYEHKYKLGAESDTTNELGLGEYYRDVLITFNDFVEWLIVRNLIDISVSFDKAAANNLSEIFLPYAIKPFEEIEKRLLIEGYLNSDYCLNPRNKKNLIGIIHLLKEQGYLKVKKNLHFKHYRKFFEFRYSTDIADASKPSNFDSSNLKPFKVQFGFIVKIDSQ
jgi:hypothetical protein